MTKNNLKNSIAVIMITLNEAHNLDRVFKNLRGWADEIFVLDSYSTDSTVDVCLRNGIKIIQKKFEGFGSQWNHALGAFDINSNWVMKLDPDEVLSDELKSNIKLSIERDGLDGFYIDRRLWFMDKPLPVKQRILRIWKKGLCKFSNSLVNEYPHVNGNLGFCYGDLKHFDSPNLEHWLQKQNKYTTSEALAAYRNHQLATQPKLFGNSLQRRMFIKEHFYKIPFRYQLLFLYHYLYLSAYKAGKVGWIWANLRCMVYRLTDYKMHEFKILGDEPLELAQGSGAPDLRCEQH